MALVVLTYGLYLAKLLLPAGLCADRNLPFSLWPALPKVVWMSGVAVATVLALRRRPLAALGVAWIVFALLPASNLEAMPTRPIAEQRAYVASAGFCVLLVLPVMRARRGAPRREHALVACVCLSFLALTVARSFVWRNEYTLMIESMRSAGKAIGGRSSITP